MISQGRKYGVGIPIWKSTTKGTKKHEGEKGWEARRLDCGEATR